MRPHYVMMQTAYFVVEWRCFACVVVRTCREQWHWEKKWNNRKWIWEKHGQEKYLVFLFHLATERAALFSSPLASEETIFKQSLDGAARNTGQNVLWFLTKSLLAKSNFMITMHQEDQSVLAGYDSEYGSWKKKIKIVTQRYFYENNFRSHHSHKILTHTHRNTPAEKQLVSCHIFSPSSNMVNIICLLLASSFIQNTHRLSLCVVYSMNAQGLFSQFMLHS